MSAILSGLSLGLGAVGGAFGLIGQRSRNRQLRAAAAERMRNLGFEQQSLVDQAAVERNNRIRQSIALRGRLRAAMGGSGTTGEGATAEDLSRQIDLDYAINESALQLSLANRLASAQYAARQDAIGYGNAQRPAFLGGLEGLTTGISTGLSLAGAIRDFQDINRDPR